MTPELIIRGMTLYLDQFDPEHAYLLAPEVTSFLSVPQSKALELVNDYDNGDYGVFIGLNQAIQKAIARSRKWRRAHPFANFDAVDVVIGRGSTLDTRSYPRNEKELQAAIELKVARMIQKSAQEEKARGQQVSLQDLESRVEAELCDFEDQYMGEDKRGVVLSELEQRNLLAFHILKALSEGLDAHSAFLDSQEASNLKMNLEKDADGIGILLQDEGNSFRVSKVIPDSPAARCGQIKAGDQLVAIDGASVADMNIEDVMQRLGGKLGTYVKVSLNKMSSSGKEQLVVVNLQRQHVVINEGRVESSFESFDGGIIGIIKLHSFYQGKDEISSEEDMRRALADLQKKGKLKGLVIDLRDNRGGFLMQAVKVAGLFIKSGVIAISKGNDGQIRYFRDVDPSVSYSGPLVILTSKLTASAAEIVAQALKDYGVAITVGDIHTYGKGSIQMQTVTGNSNDPSFKVTIGTYYTVSGKSTQLDGVAADVVVPSVFYNKKFGEEYLNFSLKKDTVSAAFQDTLTDVSSDMAGWYAKYYKPYLQRPENRYRRFIPELQQMSQARMKKNQEYQLFLQGAGFNHKSMDQIQKDIWALQLQEAVNIVEDLVVLSKKGH